MIPRGPIVYYVPGGGGGVRKVWCIKTLSPPQILHMKIVPLLAITVFEMHPSPLQPFLDQVSTSILGH